MLYVAKLFVLLNGQFRYRYSVAYSNLQLENIEDVLIVFWLFYCKMVNDAGIISGVFKFFIKGEKKLLITWEQEQNLLFCWLSSEKITLKCTIGLFKL